LHPVDPLSGNAAHFIILLCQTPDDFTHQEEIECCHFNGLIQYINNTLWQTLARIVKSFTFYVVKNGGWLDAAYG
jgi:hypothetical protein